METNIVIDISPDEILVFALWAKMLANQIARFFKM